MIVSILLEDLLIGYNTGYLIDNTDGFEFPEIRTDVRDKGNYDGASLEMYNYGRRIFRIEGLIYGSSAADYERKRRNLSRVLRFDPANGLKTMRITTRGGLIVQSDVIVKAIDMPYTKGKINRGAFRIELEAPYPYLEAITQSIVNFVPATGGGFAIPFAIPFSLANGGSGEINVYNSGNGTAYPIIRIYGTITNPSIRSTTYDKSLSITYTLAVDTDYIEIDTYLRTVKVNGLTSIVEYVSGDWFALEPGSNILRFFGTGTTAHASMVVTYNESYIGI